MSHYETQPKQQRKHSQTWNTHTNHYKHDVIFLSEENIIRDGMKIVCRGGTACVGPFGVTDVTQFEHVVGRGTGVAGQGSELVVNTYGYRDI